MIRVLLTNGLKTKVLYWIEFKNGTDVYHGTKIFNMKSSYHASGKVHTDSQGKVPKRTNEGWKSPLLNIEGVENLANLEVFIEDDYFEYTPSDLDYNGKKNDAVLIIDSRSIPKNQVLSIKVGIVAIYRLDLLQDSIMHRDDTFTVKQLLISTRFNPWIFVKVDWRERPV